MLDNTYIYYAQCYRYMWIVIIIQMLLNIILCATVGLKSIIAFCVCLHWLHSAKGYITPHFHTNVHEDEQMGCLGSTPSIHFSLYFFFFFFIFCPIPLLHWGRIGMNKLKPCDWGQQVLDNIYSAVCVQQILWPL